MTFSEAMEKQELENMYGKEYMENDTRTQTNTTETLQTGQKKAEQMKQDEISKEEAEKGIQSAKEVGEEWWVSEKETCEKRIDELVRWKTWKPVPINLSPDKVEEYLAEIKNSASTSVIKNWEDWWKSAESNVEKIKQ